MRRSYSVETRQTRKRLVSLQQCQYRSRVGSCRIQAFRTLSMRNNINLVTLQRLQLMSAHCSADAVPPTHAAATTVPLMFSSNSMPRASPCQTHATEVLGAFCKQRAKLTPGAVNSTIHLLASGTAVPGPAAAIALPAASHTDARARIRCLAGFRNPQLLKKGRRRTFCCWLGGR